MCVKSSQKRELWKPLCGKPALINYGPYSSLEFNLCGFGGMVPGSLILALKAPGNGHSKQDLCFQGPYSQGDPIIRNPKPLNPEP